ncbi:MAG: hypothetical protein JWM00_343 [Candidatus Saccharibacteria bacterium]|nr:hypothetical protein [Candidatus Saccharibacteria bacterium]
MKNKMHYLLICLSLIAGGVLAGYYYGKDVGQKETTTKLQPQVSAAKTGEETAWRLYRELSTSNEKLVNDYNDLYDAAVNYVNATQYAPRQTVHCNSYSYGMSGVSTTCQ